MKRRPLLLLASTLALSAPIYGWGALNPVHGLPFGLPGTAIMIVVPAFLASLMTYHERGCAALVLLWRSLFDLRRVKSALWVAIALLTMPGASVIAFFVMSALGFPLPDKPSVTVTLIPITLAFFFAGAALEEVGWTAYCTEPLQHRFGVTGAGLIIGTVWAAWHVVPWAVLQGHEAAWVIAQSLLTILMRVFMGHIYAAGGRSLFLATLFHATINTSYSLFPNNGSHYDPAIVCAVLAFAMLVASIARQR
jgi:hypothetical protein